MGQDDRQAVGVVLTLVGHQDTAVAVHDAKTDSAAVSVRIGRALIYMHDRDTVETFDRAWSRLSADAAALPRVADRSRLTPVHGMSEPAVVVDAAGTPPSTGKLLRVRRRRGWRRPRRPRARCSWCARATVLATRGRRRC